jgi:uncharacterized damage-inducible protein DinB
MQKFSEILFDRFHQLHSDIGEALAGLPEEAMDWKPGPDMNSVSVLIVHLAGAERYWIGDVAHGDPSNRDREAEFRAIGLDKAALNKLLADLDIYSKATFETLELADLEKLRFSPRDNRQFSVGWAIAHALEHTATHLGHVQILRQLWERKA